MTTDPGPTNDPSQYNSALSPNPFEAVQLAATYVPPPFPTWPPPSGGAPVTTPELGPITSPYPYGSAQGANISIAGPAPIKNATKYPMKMPSGANGQNQAAPPGWPTWPHAKFTTLPDKASPSLSKLP
jgi:hypothetical protein